MRPRYLAWGTDPYAYSLENPAQYLTFVLILVLYGHQFLYITNGRKSVLLCRRCDALCTSGFVDGVVFAQNARHVDTVAASDVTASSCAGQRPYSVLVRRRRAPRLDESVVQEVPPGGGACNAPLPCCR